MRKIFHLLLVIGFLSLSSCKNNSNKATLSQPDRYSEYIDQITHGIISTHDPIRVVFAQPLSNYEVGSVLEPNLVEITPKTKGSLQFADDKTLIWIPDTPLLPDTEYRINLKMDAFYPDIDKELNTFTFAFKTLKQQFSVYTEGIQSYDKNLQYVKGEIRLADLMAATEVAQLVKATQEGESVSLTLQSPPEKGRQFSFILDSIQRKDSDSELHLMWDGSPFGISTQGSDVLTIPGKDNFSVTRIEVQTQPSKMLEIHFSDPLKKNQDFKGLVSLQGDSKLKFKVTGNTLKVYPSKTTTGTLSLEVFPGIASEDDYSLKKAFQERVAFEQPKPELKVLSSGTLLPSSNNLKINFETVNLKGVDVRVYRIFENNVLQFLQTRELEGYGNLQRVARPIAQKTLDLQSQAGFRAEKWTAHALDLSALIEPEPGALYKIEFNIRPSLSLYQCEQTYFDGYKEDKSEYDQETETSYWDGSESYYYEGGYYNGYDWNERENPCHGTYYVDKKKYATVLATDIGVTVKKGANNSYFAAVTNLLDTEPMAGAKLTFYNYQQQPLGSLVTDAEGMAIFDAEESAYFVVAEAQNQKTYVKLKDGNALSMSKFNVSGAQIQKGIKGYLFAERGVWRPGDEIHLSFMLNDKANPLPSGHPIKLELFDPYQKLIKRELRKTNAENLYYFRLKTEATDQTGPWLAKLSVGGAVFTKSLRIETIKPNRLKIQAQLKGNAKTIQENIAAEIAVKWLHGATARNLDLDVSAKFDQKRTQFAAYPAHVFDDPSRSFNGEEQELFKGKLDSEGKAHFSMRPKLENKAPGKLNVAFLTKVYEDGGDFSTDVFTAEFAPYDTYVGLLVPKGDSKRNMLLTDTKHRFELQTVSAEGKPKAAQGLKVSIHKVKWRWWWESGQDNLSNYQSSRYHEEVFSKTLDTDTQGKAHFDFELKYPDWGRYLVRVEDPSGGHATGQTIYIDWPGWAGKARKGDPTEASMLRFSTDKETYQTGETAQISFPSSLGSRALLTIENGNEVLEAQWVNTQEGETKVELPITDLYTPNVFIHISLLQPHANTKNDAPMRLYGVVPIAVENPETRLAPEIQMPNTLRPETEVTVKVKEKQGKPMAYTLAVVDEGLLDLTRFKTPDPWNAFYTKEALGVKTWDVFDDVVGAYGGRINHIFAIGGDGALAGANNKKANRFKPMVLHLGPFTLAAGKTDTHTLKIPKYIGAVRTMVVAHDSDAGSYGFAEKSTPVKKPLMVLASLPRKASPGEKIKVPVTVFAMEPKVKKVTVKIDGLSGFKNLGDTSQQVIFDQTGEKMVYFDMEVTEGVAIGKLSIKASGAGERASYDLEMDLGNPNPISSILQHLVLQPKSETSLAWDTFGVAGSNGAELDISSLPPMNFNGRMQNLIRYPHGCLEQITSAAFPQLYLDAMFDLDIDRKQKAEKHIKQAIDRLKSNQLPNGGFGYWPSQNRANDWGTSYVGHFFLEAEKQGYVAPIGFKQAWIDYQRSTAKRWRAGTNHSDLNQAYRLFTLALSGNAELGAMNRLRQKTTLSTNAKYRLAAAYALIGQKQVAKEMLLGTTPDFNARNHYRSYGSVTRNKAMALETYVILEDMAKAQKMAEAIAKNLQETKWMSTQTTAYALLALSKFAKGVGGKGIQLDMGTNGKISTEKATAIRNISVKPGHNSLQLKNQGDNTLFVTLSNSGQLPIGQEKTYGRNLRLGQRFTDKKGGSITVDKVAQGTNLVMEVTVTNTNAEPIKNVALTTFLPSGWEVINTRFTDYGEVAQADYSDIRDDRVNHYFDLKKNETKTFKLLVNASYLGAYYLPGAQVEAMYDAEYAARNKGQWIQVTE